MRQLEVASGWHSKAGRRPDNQDYVASWLAGPALHGVVVAVADGVGGHAGGRVAAETTARGFLDAYLSQPETVGVRRAAARAAESMNAWVHAQGRADPARAGMATTLTVAVLRHRTLHVLHVGDSRLYRLRAGSLVQLTTDHVHEGPEQGHVLRRAVGLEDVLRADFASEPLVEGDRLLLTTDGVHGPLRPVEMARLLRQEAAPGRAARALVQAALDSGGQDNATALVLDVLALPSAAQDELAAEATGLPLRAVPEAGDVVDGYRLERLLAEGRYSALFVAVDDQARPASRVVVKFPKPAIAADAAYRAAFVREGWVASRVRSPWVGDAIEPAPGRRAWLYTVMPHYDGETLEARLRRGPPVRLRDGLGIGIGLAKGLAALHRAGIVHRDVKPDNVLLTVGADGAPHPRLIDFGVVRLPGLDLPGAPAPDQAAPGTPSYMAPELLAGAQGDAHSDVFALGVTLYRMFTGAYPYGEIEPFQRPVWRAPTPLQQRRPDLPGWLELVLSRAIAVDPGERPGDALELALELEAGAARPQVARGRRALLARDPVRFWQGCCLVLLVLLACSALLRG